MLLENQFERDKAKESISLIFQDVDQTNMLDFIGQTINIVPNFLSTTMVQLSYDFIVESHNKFITESNLIMLKRYESLRNYYESRLGIWNINPVKRY